MSGYPMAPAGIRPLRARIDTLEAKLLSITRQKAEAAEVGGNAWHDNCSFEQLQREEVMILWQIDDARRVLAQAGSWSLHGRPLP